MPSRSLRDLPPPPAGRVGWPWTEETPLAAPTLPDGRAWPSITIVTPSFNQGDYIEETIRSILLQGYPKLEYIIMDGGSTDQTVDIIRKYEHWIDHWESTPDNGQSDAINKGLACANGEIFHFINSDDVLSSGALFAVGKQLDTKDAVAGAVEVFDYNRAIYTALPRGLTARRMLNVARHARRCTYHQPGVWLRRRLIQELGGFDPEFRYCFDSHLFIRYAERWPNVSYTDNVLVRFRLHDASKSVAEIDKFGAELVRLRIKLSRTLRSPQLRDHARRSAARFAWRQRFEALLARKSARSFDAVAKCLLPIALRPDLTWDDEGRRLMAVAIDRLANAARVRLVQSS